MSKIVNQVTDAALVVWFVLIVPLIIVFPIVWLLLGAPTKKNYRRLFAARNLSYVIGITALIGITSRLSKETQQMLADFIEGPGLIVSLIYLGVTIYLIAIELPRARYERYISTH